MVVCHGDELNFYALLLSITEDFSSDKALGVMGLIKNRESDKYRESHPNMIKLSEAENIRKLYWDDDLTMADVAKIYSTSPPTILKFCRLNGIPSKPRGWKEKGKPKSRGKKEKAVCR